MIGLEPSQLLRGAREVVAQQGFIGRDAQERLAPGPQLFKAAFDGKDRTGGPIKEFAPCCGEQEGLTLKEHGAAFLLEQVHLLIQCRLLHAGRKMADGAADPSMPGDETEQVHATDFHGKARGVGTEICSMSSCGALLRWCKPLARSTQM